jgi:hypothetical protein
VSAAFAVYYWLPDWRGYLLYEDSLIENISAGLFVISFLLGVFLYRKYESHRRVLIILSTVSLFGFLEEISYGQRIYGVVAPRVYGVPIDSIHDFFSMSYKLFRDLVRHNLALVLMGSLIFFIIVNLSMMVHRAKVLDIIKKIFTDPPYILSSFFILLIILSSVIDLEIIHKMVIYMVEEILEMNAGLALLCCGLSIREQLSSSLEDYSQA